MRILKNDDQLTICAKKAAMICQYAIKNPLHVFFEDYNFHTDPMDFERICNDAGKYENGPIMHEFIDKFLTEWDELGPNEKRQAFRLYIKKSRYLSRRWEKKILENSNPKPQGSGFCYRRYLSEDGHIYVKTDKEIELLQF